jgi:hypothetical protein
MQGSWNAGLGSLERNLMCNNSYNSEDPSTSVKMFSSRLIQARRIELAVGKSFIDNDHSALPQQPNRRQRGRVVPLL